MRRPLNWLVVLLSVVVAVRRYVAAGLWRLAAATPAKIRRSASGMLRQVRDPAELEDALKRALHRRPSRRVFRRDPSRFPTVADGRFQRHVHRRSRRR